MNGSSAADGPSSKNTFAADNALPSERLLVRDHARLLAGFEPVISRNLETGAVALSTEVTRRVPQAGFEPAAYCHLKNRGGCSID